MGLRGSSTRVAALFGPFNASPDPIGDRALLAVIPAADNTDNVSSGIIAAAAQDPNSGMGNQTPLGLTRFRVTFKKAGIFRYRCLLHDDVGMKGMVIVFP
jgi:hypothetical protein